MFWWVGDQQQEGGQLWVVGYACVLVGGRSATGGWAVLGCKVRSCLSGWVSG